MIDFSRSIGLVFGAWTTYNATHPTRQNNVANLAVNNPTLYPLEFLHGFVRLDWSCSRCFTIATCFN